MRIQSKNYRNTMLSSKGVDASFHAPTQWCLEDWLLAKKIFSGASKGIWVLRFWSICLYWNCIVFIAKIIFRIIFKYISYPIIRVIQIFSFKNEIKNMKFHDLGYWPGREKYIWNQHIRGWGTAPGDHIKTCALNRCTLWLAITANGKMATG